MKPITAADLRIEGSPIIRLVLDLADGSTLERVWTIGEAAEIPVWAGRPGPREDPGADEIPDWLEPRGRDWPHPQGPIELWGRVAAGHEDEARAALGLE